MPSISLLVGGAVTQSILNNSLWLYYTLGSNSWIRIIIWLYIALNRTPNKNCYWGGSTQTILKSNLKGDYSPSILGFEGSQLLHHIFLEDPPPCNSGIIRI